MAVNMTTRKVGDVTIVKVEGRITLGDGADSFRDFLRDLAQNGEKKVILEMTETWNLDSCGVAELVSGFTTLCNQGVAVKLLGLTKRVRDLLQITKLYTVFEVFEDEGKAVRSFS